MSGINNTAPLKRDVNGNAASQIINPLEKTINRNLLRYAVGQAIFCPSCGNVMDYRRAVLATGSRHTAVLCSVCWDKALAGMQAKGHSSEEVSSRIEIIDGRIISRRSK